jgi:arylsulfatase A-like enzyme
VYSNSGPHGGFRAFLANNDQQRTFAPVLQRHGYQTGLFGKFINLYQPKGTYLGQSPYIPPGWSAWNVPDHLGYQQYGYTLAVGHQLGQYGSEKGDFLGAVLATKASQFIAASARAHVPFIAEIATYAPHGPFVPAPGDVDSFPRVVAPRGPAFGEAVQNPPGWLARIPPLTAKDKAHFDRVFRLRVQAVQSVDRMIGRLRAQIEHLGIADNTYVVFSSDNGLHLGDYNLRQGKATAFDTDIRVPLIVTGPGVPAGAVVSRLAENVDLAPTFETIAGAVPPANVDGRSLLPLLHGRQVTDWRTAVLLEHHGPVRSVADPDLPVPFAGNPPSYEAIRTADYLYVEYDDGERDFFDLTTDPAELDNRYDEMPPPLHALLHATLLRMQSCHGSASCWSAQHLAR